MRTLPIVLTPDLVNLFWSKVDVRATDECWEWLGERQLSGGYGVLRAWSGNVCVTRLFAHRISLVIAGGDVAGRVTRHDCDNPPCVNPNHLRVGTQADNVRDAVARDRNDTTGLAIGLSPVWPPRPCRRCGVIVTAGRQRYCLECRPIVTREDHTRRQRARRAAARDAGLTPGQRAKVKREREAS